jgi:membrane associated rhomboid family serine protease
MLIPVAHEDLRGRRWPWVTIGIIVINFLVFFATYGRLDKDLAQVGEVQLHILLLTAHYPDAAPTGDAARMVATFKRQHAKAYATLAGPRQRIYDGWDAEMLQGKWTGTDVQSKMTALCGEFDQLHSDSLAWNYAFHSYHPTIQSFITAQFLHGGWLHIIFNMWFLWLAGTILEDAWGRVVYPIFYLVSGLIALLVHAAVFPDSFVPCVGASGAIAGLMGGFLARFPKTKIKLMWIWGFGLIRAYKLVPAYIILPLWLVIQVFWGAMSASYGVDSGVAYWAHIGGFAFGMIGAVVLRSTGLEHAANQAIEAKVSLAVDPRIVRASEAIGGDQPDAAIQELRALVAEKPDSIDGHELLLRAYEKKQDINGEKEVLATLCRLNVASGDLQTAWNYYEQFSNLGGEKISRGVWMELCRWLETQNNWDRAASEYKRVAEMNPTERVAVQALVAAARINLTNLNRPSDAERLYNAAAASPVPHEDQNVIIEDGLKKCSAAIPALGKYTA